MKQIFNWTIGSFFRSIGRIIAYLVIGGIIAYLVSGGDFRRFKITDLFFERTHALALDGNYVSSIHLYNGNKAGYFNSTTQCGATNMCQFSVGINFDYTWSNPNNYKYLVIPFRSYSEYEQIDSGGITNVLDVSKQIFKVSINWNSGADFCELQNNYIVCSVYPNRAYNHIRLWVYSGNDQKYYIELNDWAYFYTSKMDEQIDAINQQTEMFQNTNSTQESSQASEFITDFNETAQDGIKAVVSMPLNIFNALTLGSTKDLCFTLKSKQTCFPSGALVWNKTSRTSIHVGNATYTQHAFSNQDIPTGLNAFKIIFNVVVGGFLAYKMLMSLYRITNDMLSPTKDRIEVLKL